MHVPEGNGTDFSAEYSHGVFRVSSRLDREKFLQYYELHMNMKANPSDPATQGDVRYLAELITGTTVRMDGFEGKMDGLEGKMDNLERRMDNMECMIRNLAEMMEQRFSELKNMIQSTLKYLGNHADKLENHDRRICVFEKAA